MVGAVLLNAFSTVLYVGAGLGPGPRDGLMTGLVVRTGLSVRLVRTSIEVTVLGIGWLLGGTVGVGTVVYAFGIGPLVQMFLRLTPRRLLAGSGLGLRRRRQRFRRAESRSARPHHAEIARATREARGRQVRHDGAVPETMQPTPTC